MTNHYPNFDRNDDIHHHSGLIAMNGPTIAFWFGFMIQTVACFYILWTSLPALFDLFRQKNIWEAQSDEEPQEYRAEWVKWALLAGVLVLGELLKQYRPQ